MPDPATPGSGDEAGSALLSMASAREAAGRCAAWLAALRADFPEMLSAAVLLRQEDGSYAPAAVWPDTRSAESLGAVARRALDERRGQRVRDAGGPEGPGRLVFAYPVFDGEAVQALAAVAMPMVVAPRDRQLADRMLWGSGWLAELLAQRELAGARTRLSRSSFLFELVAEIAMVSHRAQADTTVVNRLAGFLGADAVALGWRQAGHVRVRALSGSAHVEPSAGPVRLAAAAMDEAIDQASSLSMPGDPDDPLLVLACVREYASARGGAGVLVVPLGAAAGASAGALLFERRTPFDASERRFLETVALAVGPLLDLRAQADASALARLRRRGADAIAWLFGASHPGWKLAGVLGVVVLAVLAAWPVTHHVSARAVVEGEVQRAVVAPFDGYVREAPRRAGDTVRAGELIARMEDKDLLLERTRWEAELELAVRKEREALASGERVARRLAQAQAEQARAQRDLVLEKLVRSRIVAPFDGVIVRGDLSQQLGSPVEIGKLLFEVAPLDAWRVVVKIDERDIARVRTDQPGQLALASLPGQRWPVRVSRLTSVASAEDGANVFRAEARIEQGSPRLRPGMEGVARLPAGERSLLSIATYRFLGWLELGWWRWQP